MIRRRTESFGRAIRACDVVPQLTGESNPYASDVGRFLPDHRKRLTKKQRMVLDECLTAQRPLADVLDDHHVSTERFARWLDRAAFRKHLEKLFRALSRQLEIDVAIGGVRAAELLSRAVDRATVLPEPAQARAAEAIVRLSRMGQAHRKAEALYAGPQRTEDCPPIAHPELRQQRIRELMAKLDGKRPRKGAKRKK
jgi:hypothetical protein